MLGECSRHLNTQVAWVFLSRMVTLINCYFPLRNTEQLSFPAGIMWSGYTGLLSFGRCVSEDLTCSYFMEYSCVIWMLTASNYNDRFNPLRLDTTFPVKLISPATHKFPWKSGDPSEVCGFVGILGHIPFDTFSYDCCLQFFDVLQHNHYYVLYLGAKQKTKHNFLHEWKRSDRNRQPALQK